MIPAVTAIVWVVGSFLVGLFSIHRRLGFWGGFIFSVIISPVLMLIILMLTRSTKTNSKKA